MAKAMAKAKGAKAKERNSHVEALCLEPRMCKLQ